jgi:hypothetical protein
MKANNPKQPVNDVDEFQAALSSRVERDLPAWYGNQARLAGAPEFQERHWSFFFRYPIRISETRSAAILVKLRHIKQMTVAEAAVHAKMGREIREEYESLRQIESVFSSHADASLFAVIRPLAWYEDMNAIVMEEADIRTLKDLFHAPAMWIEGNARRRFETLLERAARWLRIYHDHFGQAAEGPLFPKTLYEESSERLSRIQAACPDIDLRFAKDLLDDLYRAHGQTSHPYNILHNNFSMSNVFITRNGKICSFDPHNKPGPLYYDLAKFLIDLTTSNLQVITQGRMVPFSRLRAFNEAFLNGYFRGGSADRQALRLFYLLILLEKWGRHENIRLQASGKMKYLYLIGARYMQNYYLHLLRRQAEEIKQNLRIQSFAAPDGF